jgi:hypothetical protein
MIPQPLLRSNAGYMPTDGILIPPCGLTCCSSLGSMRGCGTRPSKPPLAIAGQCDGIRCDVAMLLLNAIFETHVGTSGAPASRNRVLGGDHATRRSLAVAPAEAEVGTMSLALG